MSSLEELLGELYTPEIEAKLPENLVVYIWDKSKDTEKDKEPIPKHRVNEMLETQKAKNVDLEKQISTFEEQRKEYDKQLKDLKKAAEGNPELQKTIDDLQKENKGKDEAMVKMKEDTEKMLKRMEKESKLKDHLLAAEVFDPEARELLSKKFDIEKLELGEDGKFKGFDDLLKPIKENKAFEGFFGKEIVRGNEHRNGGDPNAEFYTREQLEKMTPQQAAENIEKVNKSVVRLTQK